VRNKEEKEWQGLKEVNKKFSFFLEKRAINK
jgi:hypothetical protein